MLKNYFKIAWRSLFKNKFHTSLNLAGLIIGFTIGIVVLLIVYGQFSFDRNHLNRKKIYQAYLETYRESGTEISNVFGYPAAPAFKSEASSIDAFTRFLHGSNLLLYKNREYETSTMLVDEDFLRMFTFPVVKGSKGNLLKSLTDIVITEKTAKNIFGTEDPVGKTFQSAFGNELKEFTVVAVVKDYPLNSSIRFDALARIENRSDYAADKNNWNNQHHFVFVMLRDGAAKQQAEQQLRSVNQKYLQDWVDNLKRDKAKPDKNGDVMAAKLLSMEEMHFQPNISGHNGVNKAQVYIMLVIGLVIILIASFNYININLANALTRSKEIGVRKCLGAAREKLFIQLWSESFLLCFISFALSLLSVSVIVGMLQQHTIMNMPLRQLLWEPSFIAIATGLLLLVSFIAGGYPSWLMAKFKVVETLKGQVVLKRKSLVRSSLIVTQFVIACVMICCTLVIYKQFNYLRNADLGINKEFVISVPIKKHAEGRQLVEKLRTRLSSNPQILSVTGSSINIGLGLDKSTSKMTNGFGYKGKTINTNIAFVDYDYLKTFNIKPIEGRDISTTAANDTLQHVVLTESAAAQFGEKQIAGSVIKVDSTMPSWNIVAVIPDFHLYSLREQKEPLSLVFEKNSSLSYCFIKTNGQNKTSVMNAIQKEMAVLEPGREFKGSFIDDNIEALYKQEKMISLVFSIASGIAIALSCLGLLAMVLLMIQQRIKEIGVRKVLGAGVPQISVMISKEYLALVIIAVLIATPLSWLAMHQWLQEFAYRIDLSWWMFVAVAIIALTIAAFTISYSTVKAALQNPVKSLRTE